MFPYLASAVFVVIGGIALIAGILMGVSEPANYLVEGAFTAFGLAGAVFVLSVVFGLAKEFRETA